jgi:hypothetical protein
MDSLLVAAAATSIGLGAAMTLFAWNVMRRNRRRETARAVLLSGLAFPGGMAGDVTDDPAPDTNRMFHVDEFRREPPLDTGPLFSEPEGSGAASRRSMALAAVGLVMAAAIGTYWWFAGSRAAESPETEPVSSATTVAVTPAPVAPRARVELLALNHTATRAAFVVTGRIRNPADAAPLHDIVAVVHLVDAAGRVVMTVRAPVKRAVLNGGEFSEFSAPAAKATNVARYRVEFHAKEREALPQIDLRARTDGT